MDDGRCPDKVWSAAAKALRDSSKLLEAAKEKKVASAKAARPSNEDGPRLRLQTWPVPFSPGTAVQRQSVKPRHRNGELT